MVGFFSQGVGLGDLKVGFYRKFIPIFILARYNRRGWFSWIDVYIQQFYFSNLENI